MTQQERIEQAARNTVENLYEYAKRQRDPRGNNYDEGYLDAIDVQGEFLFKKGAEWALSHQWISVDEELPKDEAIFTNGLSVGIGHLTDDMDCDCYNGVLICGVTHWAEIPKFNE